MHIYAQEIEDGIDELIKSSASISYASVVEPGAETSKAHLINFKSLASYSDNDLYYVHSILVSSSWNKNDDIFDKNEVWKARNTPEDKPTNLNHDENLIVGHITANWPITMEGILIDENTPLENLPDKYHILTGSVIYKGFTDPALRERTQALIDEIENGQKYVSMECFFKGFDYGLINKKNQEYKILARNENTAYLSKYLRAYGGLGEHDNYQIGRVLRQITFTGKGFVDKPANPDSIIFTYQNLKTSLEEKTAKKSQSGVSNFQSNLKVENITMSSEQEVQTEVETVETQAPVSENNTSALETALAETQSALEAIKLEKEEAAKKMDEEMKKKKEELMKMKAELEAANEVIAAYRDKEMEMMKKEKKMKRMAALVEAGIESAEAEITVDKFDSLEDDAFNAMTTLLAAKKAKVEKEMMKEVKASDNADTSALDNVEVDETEVNLSVGGQEESAVESTRAALVEFVCARLGKKLNKGE